MNQPLRTMRLSAVASLVLYLGFAFVPTLPEGSYPDERVAALFAVGAERGLIVLSGVLLTLAGLALLPFLAGLWELLRRGPATTAPAVAALAGVLHVGMLLVAATAFSGYATGLAVGELAEPVDTTVARVLSNQGFHGLLIPGLLAAGALIVSTVAAGSHLLPTWLRRTSIALAALTLLGAAWAPQFVPVVWAVLVAWGARTPGAADPAATTARPVADVGTTTGTG